MKYSNIEYWNNPIWYWNNKVILGNNFVNEIIRSRKSYKIFIFFDNIYCIKNTLIIVFIYF